MTFKDAVELWLGYRAKLVEVEMLEASTHRSSGKTATMWIEHLGEWSLIEVKKSLVELALGRMSKTRSPVTQQGDMKVLNQIFNWCVDEGYLAQKPRMPVVKVPLVEQELPSDDDFVAAINAVGDKHQRALRFMMLTGLAPHECERLREGDYNKARDAIGIGMRDDFAVKTASRRRWVPMNDEARSLVPYIPFPSVSATEKALQRARHNMPDTAHCITPKMMRKWFSSKLAHDCAEHVLQRLLGHAPGSKVTRQHYVRSNQADIEHAVSGLETPQGE